jgi:hypothetical protein
MLRTLLTVFLALPFAASAGGFDKGCPSDGSRPNVQAAAATSEGSKFTFDDFKQQDIQSFGELAVVYKRSSPTATLIDLSLKIYQGDKLRFQTTRNPAFAKDKSPDGRYVLDPSAAKQAALYFKPEYTFIIKATEKDPGAVPSVRLGLCRKKPAVASRATCLSPAF